MYYNQLIISFVVFGALLYLMSLKSSKSSKSEQFFSTANYSNPNYTFNQPDIMYDEALYYHPSNVNYQPKQHLPNNANNSNNSNCSSAYYQNLIANQKFKEDFKDSNTEYDDVMSPKIGRNDNKTIKITFCLLFIGMLYLGYSNNWFMS